MPGIPGQLGHAATGISAHSSKDSRAAGDLNLSALPPDDTEIQADSWLGHGSGWVPLYFCDVNAAGQCGSVYYSDVWAVGDLDVETWKDANGTAYTKMTDDAWQFQLPGEYGYTDQASVVAATYSALHYDDDVYVTGVSPGNGMCPISQFPTTQPATYCVISNYNNQGYHYYSPWEDANVVWFGSGNGYITDCASPSYFDCPVENDISG
jgi:hypothetical protein